MSRKQHTRIESRNALHRALLTIWHRVHTDKHNFDRINLYQISRYYNVSSLKRELLRPLIMRSTQPTLDDARALREMLTYESRGKGGHRTQTFKTEDVKRQPVRTLFDFNNYDAVEEINRLQEVLSSNGYTSHNLSVTIYEDRYELSLKITKQTK